MRAFIKKVVRPFYGAEAATTIAGAAAKQTTGAAAIQTTGAAAIQTTTYSSTAYSSTAIATISATADSYDNQPATPQSTSNSLNDKLQHQQQATSNAMMSGSSGDYKSSSNTISRYQPYLQRRFERHSTTASQTNGAGSNGGVGASDNVSALIPNSSVAVCLPTHLQSQQQKQQQSLPNKPTSSSLLSANTKKAFKWKSNEGRRRKTYNCSACNKGFTSSQHLRRHNYTMQHKIAVQSSGQPDPATLPFSVKHHSAREGGCRLSRRNKAAAAAAAQQQPTAPLTPPAPPRNSLSSYGAAQSEYQQKSLPYKQQAQSTTTTAVVSPQPQPQHNHIASNMAATSTNAQQAHTVVLNGHLNGLAAHFALPTATTMPSSQMRGVLNNTTTAAASKIISNTAQAFECLSLAQ